jgi:hypothetical protein
MKKYFCCLLLCIAVGVWTACAEDTETNFWGPANCNEQLSIAFKDNGAGIKTNQPFNLEVRIKNLSTNQTIRLNIPMDPEVDAEFWFEVLAPSGTDVSPKLNSLPHGSGSLIIIPPNQVYERTFNLSALCGLHEIGIYKIIAKRAVFTSASTLSCVVISNPLSLSVIPGEWKSPTNAPSGPFGAHPR